MAVCSVCGDLRRRDDSSFHRLALDFGCYELIESATTGGCKYCLVILNSIRRFERDLWDFPEDIRRIYLYALEDADEAGSLRMELYFYNERPKVSLEIFQVATGEHQSLMEC